MSIFNSTVQSIPYNSNGMQQARHRVTTKKVLGLVCAELQAAFKCISQSCYEKKLYRDITEVILEPDY